MLLVAEEELLHEAEVGFGVDANGVVVGGLHVDVEAILEEPKLFEALGAFELAWRQGGKAIERRLAIGVEADVFPVLGQKPRLRIATWGPRVALVGDSGTGEVERATVGGGDDFYGVRVGDVFWSAEDFERGDVDVRVREGTE